MKRNEAIEIVREYYPSSSKDLNEALETLIPELKESDDEMIRKEAISIIRQYNNICEKEGDKCEIVDRVIAWLEKQGEQKPAEWSKEDEDMLACCEIAIDFFKNLGKNSSGHPHPNHFDLDEKTYPERVIEWLKSLKSRYAWKPSDGQMQALELVVQYHAFANTDNREKIVALFNELKKFKG